jgi:hypothetical protein
MSFGKYIDFMVLWNSSGFYEQAWDKKINQSPLSFLQNVPLEKNNRVELLKFDLSTGQA